jgi:hypothetical protein
VQLHDHVVADVDDHRAGTRFIAIASARTARQHDRVAWKRGRGAQDGAVLTDPLALTLRAPASRQAEVKVAAAANFDLLELMVEMVANCGQKRRRSVPDR